MKFSILSATLILAASSANALSIDQQVFSIGLSAFNFLDRFFPTLGTANDEVEQTSFLQRAAEFLNWNIDNIPAEIKKDWSQMEADHPYLLETHKFVSEPIAHQRRPDSEWDVIVKNEFDFPQHSLRLKSPIVDLGIDSVKQFTGYLDVEDEKKHFFVWFFESRNDPKNDPVILWLNGGPGCSSMTGLLFELGPASIGKKIKPISNEFAWNNNASVIFLDQPVNTGFSYSEEKVGTTRAAGKDVYALLSLFFEEFPEYNGNGFHISGESYAGHYIPGIATEILEHPESERNFNLTSILIGNGWIDVKNQAPAYKEMACGNGGYKPVLDADACESYNDHLPLCQRLAQRCYDHQNPFACIPADYACNMLLTPYIKTGLNVYDIRGPCDGDPEGECYIGLDYVDEYLNRPDVQTAIGVEPTKFEGCTDSVYNSFLFTGDSSRPFQFDIAQLLDQGLPVLIYAGDKDFICNWVGQVMWIDALKWTGAVLYKDAKVRTWETEDEGVAAGTVKSAHGLTFLRVYDAGHMVPYDQPKNALEMVNRWISGDRSFK